MYQFLQSDLFYFSMQNYKSLRLNISVNKEEPMLHSICCFPPHSSTVILVQSVILHSDKGHIIL